MKDDSKIFEYIRSKEGATTGISALEAIKRQLNKENNNRKSRFVEGSTKVKIRTIELKSITITAFGYYEKVEPRKSVSKNGLIVLDGVVFYDDKTNEYKLIDGYHRLKNLNNEGKTEGRYIILSN